MSQSEELNKDELVESIFGVKVFSYEKFAGVFEGEITCTNITFAFESLKEYNGNDVSLTDDWTISVWTKDGEKIHEFLLIDVPEFRSEMRKVLDEKDREMSS